MVSHGLLLLLFFLGRFNFPLSRLSPDILVLEHPSIVFVFSPIVSLSNTFSLHFDFRGVLGLQKIEQIVQRVVISSFSLLLRFPSW